MKEENERGCKIGSESGEKGGIPIPCNYSQNVGRIHNSVLRGCNRTLSKRENIYNMGTAWLEGKYRGRGIEPGRSKEAR
jgi:hypothetical protein